MRKINKGVIALFLIVIVFVVSFFEYKLKSYKFIDPVTVYQVNRDVHMVKGQELNKNMFKKVVFDRTKVEVPSDCITTLNDIDTYRALEDLNDSDILTKSKIINNKKWCDNQETLYWLGSKNDQGIAANDLRPGDVVNIYIFDPKSQTYKEDPDFNTLQIIDIKNKDSVSYNDSKDQSFVASSLCFKLQNSQLNKMLNNLKIANWDYQISINGNRPKYIKKVNSNDSGLINK